MNHGPPRCERPPAELGVLARLSRRGQRSLCWLGLVGCLSCSKPEPPARRTEPWLASATANASSALPHAAGPLAFHFTPESTVRFSVPGKRAKVAGQVPVKGGTLRLDPLDLKTAAARLEVDLTQLSIDESTVPSEGEASATTPSETAREWLELGAEVPPEKRNQFGLARFELASVEGVSATALDFGANGKGRVRVSAVGTLLLHGFRAPVRAELVLTAMEGSPGAPRKISIRSATPLVLDLVPHDVVARGRTGVVDTLALGRSAEWIGKRAHIQVELVAETDLK
jgi:hypothetical protein